ncbi:MAG: protein kinase [Alphaproteobacteria bacterium]|nr:protein kinase [Alphaproteobacteria bacterium]
MTDPGTSTPASHAVWSPGVPPALRERGDGVRLDVLLEERPPPAAIGVDLVAVLARLVAFLEAEGRTAGLAAEHVLVAGDGTVAVPVARVPREVGRLGLGTLGARILDACDGEPADAHVVRAWLEDLCAEEPSDRPDPGGLVAVLPAVGDAWVGWTSSRPGPAHDVPTRIHTALTESPDDRRRFRFERCLGRGGFGEVYLATMRSPGGVTTRVAVKLLRENVDPRAQAVRRLKDEARVLGALEHPSILSARDLVLIDERVAMLTEYVPGADLDTCLDGADPPPLRAVLEVLAAAADALDAAWNARDPDGAPLHLVHRDIKPSNLRIGLHGQVKVLDFGIARFATSREAHTQVDQLIGTVSYMAPERMADGVAHPHGDVYALGAILYEALAGALLWGDVTQREQFRCAMLETEHQAFVEARMAGLDAPADVLAVLRATLAHTPEARPSARQLALRLEELRDTLPGKSLRQWCRDHTWPTPDALASPLVGRTMSEGRSSSTTRPALPRSSDPTIELARPHDEPDEPGFVDPGSHDLSPAEPGSDEPGPDDSSFDPHLFDAFEVEALEDDDSPSQAWRCSSVRRGAARPARGSSCPIDRPCLPSPSPSSSPSSLPSSPSSPSRPSRSPVLPSSPRSGPLRREAERCTRPRRPPSPGRPPRPRSPNPPSPRSPNPPSPRRPRSPCPAPCQTSQWRSWPPAWTPCSPSGRSPRSCRATSSPSSPALASGASRPTSGPAWPGSPRTPPASSPTAASPPGWPSRTPWPAATPRPTAPTTSGSSSATSTCWAPTTR